MCPPTQYCILCVFIISTNQQSMGRAPRATRNQPRLAWINLGSQTQLIVECSEFVEKNGKFRGKTRAENSARISEIFCSGTIENKSKQCPNLTATCSWTFETCVRSSLDREFARADRHRATRHQRQRSTQQMIRRRPTQTRLHTRIMMR